MKNRHGEKLSDREREIDDKLKELNRRHGRNQLENSQSSRSDSVGYGNAFRLSSEFISAILVGTAIGYGIDWLAGTSPWAMILFLMLGFVAGVLNVLRASGEMSASGQETSGSSENEK